MLRTEKISNNDEQPPLHPLFKKKNIGDKNVQTVNTQKEVK